MEALLSLEDEINYSTHFKKINSEGRNGGSFNNFLILVST